MCISSYTDRGASDIGLIVIFNCLSFTLYQLINLEYISSIIGEIYNIYHSLQWA